MKANTPRLEHSSGANACEDSTQPTPLFDPHAASKPPKTTQQTPTQAASTAKARLDEGSSKAPESFEVGSLKKLSVRDNRDMSEGLENSRS